MNHRSEYDALFRLPIAERLELVHDLWDSIAAEKETSGAPVSEALAQELRERLAEHEANPESGLSWEEVQRQSRED